MDERQVVASRQAWKVAGELSGAILDPGENRVWSPACATHLLAVAREGSAGATRAELDRLLGEGSFLGHAGSSANTRSGSRPDPFGLRADGGWMYDGYEASSAVAAWLADGRAKPEEGFLRMCERSGVDVAFADLADPRAGEAVTGWISEQTRGLLSPEVLLSPEALACLVSALYLRDAWESPFDNRNTEVMTFHGPSGDVEAAFMRGERDCGVVESDGIVAVSVPLSSMAKVLLALPPEGGADLASTVALLERLAGGEVGWEPVDISLPRFECETTVEDLCPFLARVGVATASAMDLAPMVGAGSAPAQIVHGAKLAVDENGVEAGAYTMMVVVTGALLLQKRPRPRRLVLDRPFAVALVSRTGAPLFLGTVARPSLDTAARDE